MASRWETIEIMTDFISLGSKITADGDCSHEIKRCLILGRKAMTNLDSILKSRDITLPAKVQFSSVQSLSRGRLFATPWIAYSQSYGIFQKSCKDERVGPCQRIAAFELWCWRRLLRVPCTARRSNQSILKKISSEYSLEELMLKLKFQYFGHLMWRADLLEEALMLAKIEGRRRRE